MLPSSFRDGNSWPQPQTEVRSLSSSSHQIVCDVFVEFHLYECAVLTLELTPKSWVPTAIGLTPIHCILMVIRLTICHVLITIGLTPVRCEVGTHLFSTALSSMSMDVGLLLCRTWLLFKGSPCVEDDWHRFHVSWDSGVAIPLATGFTPREACLLTGYGPPTTC